MDIIWIGCKKLQIVINNEDCYNRYGDYDNTHWISNGVDFDIFHCDKEISTRKPKVIWTGSTKFHRCKNYETILINTDKKDVLDNLYSYMLKLFITYLD